MSLFNEIDKMDEDIAVIGIGCNFPGGKVVEIFLRIL